MRVFADVLMPPSPGSSWVDRWDGEEAALVSCWLRGIEKAQEDPELAARARADELPLLAWRGGVDRPIKARDKVGSLNYLAMWQGLRGQCLDIGLDQPLTLVCSRTSVPVTFLRLDLMLAELAQSGDDPESDS